MTLSQGNRTQLLAGCPLFHGVGAGDDLAPILDHRS